MSARWTPTQHPEEVERTVRALRPHIGARLPLPDGTFLGVLAGAVDGPTRAPAGGLVRTEGDRLLLDCHGGALELTEVRPPGGRPMAARDWLRGRPDAALVNFRFDPALPDRGLDEVLAAARAEWTDADDEWQPHVCALAARGSRDVLDAMVELAAEPDAGLRELAAYVLGQLGDRGPGAARPSRRRRCARWPQREEDPGVLAAIACAFGHLGAPHGDEWLLAQRAHPDADVREAVAFALGGRPGEAALEALIGLSADAEPRVRDWATFALGTLAEQDGAALRDALAARLEDPDEDTRLEAVHGLAVRGDARAQAPARDLLARAHGRRGQRLDPAPAQRDREPPLRQTTRGAAGGAPRQGSWSWAGYQAGAAAGSAGASAAAAGAGSGAGASAAGAGAGSGAGASAAGAGAGSGAGASAAGAGAGVGRRSLSGGSGSLGGRCLSGRRGSFGRRRGRLLDRLGLLGRGGFLDRRLRRGRLGRGRGGDRMPERESRRPAARRSAPSAPRPGPRALRRRAASGSRPPPAASRPEA